MKKLIAPTLAFLILSSTAFASNRDPNIAYKNAFYWIPVRQELTQYSGFQLKDFSEKLKDSIIKIEYNLPEELVGNPTKVEFEGPATPNTAGKIELRGLHGTLICDTNRKSCQASYRDLSIDKDAVKSQIEKISKSPEEFSARVLVAETFSTEGVGFIIYNP